MTSKQITRENNIHAVTAAALELFLKNGIENSTIDDIATLANVSKMSIFRYFENKADIVKAATIALFSNVDYRLTTSAFSDDNIHLTGMQLAKKQLKLFTDVIENDPQFLNYLCELVLFLSKHEIDPKFPQKIQLDEVWSAALERGMADKSIAYIKNHKTFYRTVHSLYVGIILRLYLEKKDLSLPEIAAELKARTGRITDMVIKYLEP